MRLPAFLFLNLIGSSFKMLDWFDLDFFLTTDHCFQIKFLTIYSNFFNLEKIVLTSQEETKQAWTKPELEMVSIKEITLNAIGPGIDLALLSS